MKHPNTLKGRRQLAAAAVFVITTLGLATGILAEDRRTEQANIEAVNAFIAAWSEPDEAVTFLAADASVRMIESQPAVVGRAAIAPAPGMPSLRRLRRSLTQDGSACVANESCGFVS